MKKYFIGIAAFVVATGLLYSLFSFCNLTVDFYVWSGLARGIFSVLTLFIFWPVFSNTVEILEHEAEKKEKIAVRKALFLKLSKIENELQIQNREIIKNQSIFVSESRIDLSKLNKEDFLNL